LVGLTKKFQISIGHQLLTEPLKVGIAGYGVVGQRRRQFVDLDPRLEVTAVCDRKYSDDGVFDDGVLKFSNYRSLLTEDLDILFVCLTNDIAPDVTIAGLENGLHVFCEKPPGRDVADIARVIETENLHPELKLMYGFNHRYHDSVRDALALVQLGDLGQVLNLRGIYGKSKFISFSEHSDWRTKREIAGGGILLDQGIHMVDLIRLFTGKNFIDINSFISNAYWNHDIEDNAYVLMRTRDGVVAMLHSTATQWRHRFSLDITLEKGSISLAGILTGSKSYGAETMTVAYAADDDQGDPKEVTTEYDTDNSWADEITEFTDVILANRPITSGSSEEALKTMELVYRIYCADHEWKEKWGLSVQNPISSETEPC
jgi:predicted dehydrogenase